MSFLYINNIRVFDNGTLSVIFSGLRPTARRLSIGSNAGVCFIRVGAKNFLPLHLNDAGYRSIRQPAVVSNECRCAVGLHAGAQSVCKPVRRRSASWRADDLQAGVQTVCKPVRGTTTCREKLRNCVTSFNN
jgi:hypothetical protein